MFIELEDTKNLLNLMYVCDCTNEDNVVIYTLTNGSIIKEVLADSTEATNRVNEVKATQAGGGGGSQPTGTINIVNNGIYNVSSYANANVSIDKNTKITTTFDDKASKPHNHIVELPMIDTSAVTNGNQMFEGYQQLVTIPQIDTSAITSFQYMFRRCFALTNVPILDTHLVTTFRETFAGCTSLSNQSLDNILVMCINATSYTGTKKLTVLGIRTTDYSQELIESLPHYQEFIDAGWSS